MASAISQAFEHVLQKVGAKAVQVDDGGDWFRFELDDRRYEAGLKDDAWLVTIPVGALKTDPAVLAKIIKAIGSTNNKLPKGMRPGQLAEQDGYLHVRATAPMQWLQNDAEALPLRLENTLAGVRKLLPHESVAKLLREFGQ